MKLNEVTPNKYNPSSLICKCYPDVDSIIEVVVIENDKDNKLLKVAFLSSCGGYKQGDIIWKPYDYFANWTIIKENKSVAERPILS